MIRQLIFLIIFSTTLYSQDSINIATTEYPPFQYKNNNQIDGVSAEIVKAILKKAEIKYEMEILPWARAELYLGTKEILFFNLSKTADRMDRYQWIAPITPNNPIVWKLRTRDDIKITKLRDFRNYVIGVLPNSVEEKYFMTKGVPKTQFSEVSLNQQNVEKLSLGRIDLLPLDETVFKYISKKLGYREDMFEKAYSLSELNNSSFLVASLNVSSVLVKKLQVAWKILNTEGIIDSIRSKYTN